MARIAIHGFGRIGRSLMKVALKDTPDTPFRIPPAIKLISVDVHSGMRATGPGTIMEASQ